MGTRGPLPERDKVRHLKVADNINKASSSKASVQSGVVKVAPNAPTWLDREGKAEWRRVVPELERLGLISRLDRAVLGAYCDAWSKFNQARRILRKDGVLVMGHRNVQRKHPAWQIYRDALSECRSLWKELALTPVSRHRMEMPEVAHESTAEALLD